MQRKRSLTSLIVGDLLVWVLITVIGRISHQLPLTVGAILWTTFPFALAWLVIAPLAGLYRPDILTRYSSVTWRALVATLIAAPLGSFLRHTPGPPHPFHLLRCHDRHHSADDVAVAMGIYLVAMSNPLMMAASKHTYTPVDQYNTRMDWQI